MFFNQCGVRIKFLSQFSGIILTSQRSVESVYQANPNLTDEWRGKRNFCVGKKTSETALRLLNVTRVLGEDCGNAEKLSALIVQGIEQISEVELVCIKLNSNFQRVSSRLLAPALTIPV